MHWYVTYYKNMLSIALACIKCLIYFKKHLYQGKLASVDFNHPVLL